MEPTKFFNFTMPFDMYTQLQMISRRDELPISHFIRRGITLVLTDSQGKAAKRSSRDNRFVEKY